MFPLCLLEMVARVESAEKQTEDARLDQEKAMDQKRLSPTPVCWTRMVIQ